MEVYVKELNEIRKDWTNRKSRIIKYLNGRLRSLKGCWTKGVMKGE